ncbi:MAG TPA: hypothetical protein VFF28_02400 [Candidatus Nanoarchaeia archaeon]|nr:hypothetical protein [Candidatus Nanoarchaeia archaeon]
MKWLALFLLGLFVVSPILGRYYIQQPLKVGQSSVAYFTVRNDMRYDINDAKVELYIYSLGLSFRSIEKDIPGKDHALFRMGISVPRWVEPGEYFSRITVGNDRKKDVEYSYLRIV